MNLLTIVIVLTICALLFGGYGYRREPSWGYVGFSPFALLLVILLLYMAGVLR